MFFKKSAKTKATEIKIDSSTSQVLDLEAQKKRLEMERDQIQLELENQKKREGMKLEVEAHKHTLKLQEEKAVFDREKKIWEKEKEELIARAKREREEFESRLKQENELKTQEAVTLTKLEAQQKIKQAELDKERETNSLKTVHAEALAKVKSDTAEEYYKKLTVAYQDMQVDGDKNTKFVQELIMNVLKSPLPRTGIDVGVSVETPRLEAPTRNSAQ